MRIGAIFAAGAVSLGVHLAVVILWLDRQVVLPGGSIAGEVSLGTSFANLVSGTVSGDAGAEQLTPPAEAAPVARITPARPVTVTTSRPAVLRSASPVIIAAAPAPLSASVTPTEARAALAPQQSTRPMARPPEPDRTAATNPQQTLARQGNAEVSATLGQQTGSARGSVAQSNAATQTTGRQVGQAEISDYTSRVAARVIRVAERMRSRGAEGDVIVGMQITASGGLSAVTIVQSSGNSRADAIARDAIARAAPFDPPPGAQPISVRFGVRLVAGN